MTDRNLRDYCIKWDRDIEGRSILCKYGRDLLMAIRQERAMTQNEFAKMLGISRCYLNMIEKGHRPVTAKVVERMKEMEVTKE